MSIRPASSQWEQGELLCKLLSQRGGWKKSKKENDDGNHHLSEKRLEEENLRGWLLKVNAIDLTAPSPDQAAKVEAVGPAIGVTFSPWGKGAAAETGEGERVRLNKQVWQEENKKTPRLCLFHWWKALRLYVCGSDPE